MAPTPPSGRQLQLAAHDQALVVVEVGGGIRSYRAGGEDVLEPYGEDEMCSGGRGQLLAPWPNRLGDGAFEWAGRRLQTAVTEVERNNAIHGLVRWANWVLPTPETLRSPYTPATPVDTTSVSYRLHPQSGWPWTLDFRVAYRLSDAGLEVRTSVSNVSSEPCPVGFGWHPYLKAFGGLVDDVELTLPAAVAYRSDERGLPTSTFAVSGTELDFTAGRPIGSARLDVAFGELARDQHGRAIVELTGPGGQAVRLWVDETYSHLMIFTGDTLSDPARRRRGLAVEPMTCAPDMLRSGDGRRVLAAGETLSASWGVQAVGTD